MKLPDPEFFTFSDLLSKWNASVSEIHQLIAKGKLVPAIILSGQERYPGGEFRGAGFVGDIESGGHTSYSDYYVGTDLYENNHHENWPECDRKVFCHFPQMMEDDNYSFQFFSEYCDPSITKKWFYFNDGNTVNGRTDGERRFRFSQFEVKRFEAVAKKSISVIVDYDKDTVELVTKVHAETKTWQESAREFANEFHIRDKTYGAYTSLREMSGRVAIKMRENNIGGPRGPLSAGTILRESLQGGKWSRPSQK